jgi:glycosyltransferase involved in cell wall biosynthesis
MKSKKIKKNLVSIIIPAYNNKNYIMRCLKSIYNQSFANIEVIISDDMSKTPLKKFIIPYLKKKIALKNIKVKYFYQKKNIGVYQNIKFLYLKSSGEYLIIMPHDDYFLNKNFIKESIRAINYHKVEAVIANSIDKFNNKKQFLINAKEQIFNGKYFIIKKLFKNIEPAYSGIIIKNKNLISANYEKTFISKDFRFKHNIEPDEYFIALIISIYKGNVLIKKKIVSARGYSKNSFSRSPYWRKYKNINISISNLILFYYFWINKSYFLSLFFLKRVILNAGFNPFNVIVYKIFKKKTINLIILLSRSIFYIKKKFKSFYLEFISPAKRLLFN